MMYMSDDPAMDAELHMRDMDERRARRPVCLCCQRHITEHEALHLVERELNAWVCLECIDEKMEYIEVDE